MQNIEDIPSRVDHERYYSAIGVADFIAAHHDEEGTYNVNEHWGPPVLINIICTFFIMMCGDKICYSNSRIITFVIYSRRDIFNILHCFKTP